LGRWRGRGRALLLTVQGLLKAKSKARKNGIWYEALSCAERAIIDLTIRCVEIIRSPTLARTITKIVSKIKQALGKSFLQKAQEVGSDLAKNLSLVASKWGHKTAQEWKDDHQFIKFLGVTVLNT
jgi:hypothetical protein